MLEKAAAADREARLQAALSHVMKKKPLNLLQQSGMLSCDLEPHTGPKKMDRPRLRMPGMTGVSTAITSASMNHLGQGQGSGLGQGGDTHTSRRGSPKAR